MRATYTNFADAAAALGMKIKRKAAAKEQPMSCPNCGNEMRNVPGTNVWLCEWAALTEEDFGGEKVQVFTTCGNRVLAAR